MSSPNVRSVWKLLFNNIRNSLNIIPPKGKWIGQDHLGNCYYERAIGKHTSRKSPSRWFVPKEKDDWQQDLPAEWEAWLRGRRDHAPTEEEVLKNLSIAQMKKAKGDELAFKAQKERLEAGIETTEKTGFPDFQEFEKEPGYNREIKNKFEKK